MPRTWWDEYEVNASDHNWRLVGLRAANHQLQRDKQDSTGVEAALFMYLSPWLPWLTKIDCYLNSSETAHRLGSSYVVLVALKTSVENFGMALN